MEVKAYGNVEKPRQKAAGLSHISTGPIEPFFISEFKGKKAEQCDNFSAAPEGG